MNRLSIIVMLAGIWAGSYFLAGNFANSAEETEAQTHPLSSHAAKLVSAELLPDSGMMNAGVMSPSLSLYYKRNWGVEVIGVHPVASGYMLDFRFRIVDPVKARQLNNMKSKAFVIDEVSGKRLAVPVIENAGELQSGAEPEEGRTYFIVFGNPELLVKSGSRVSVVIGSFRVDGLVVD